MSLPDDLLEQAAHLVSREPRRPKQASLRRAVSAAYYALFHLLNADAASTIAPHVTPDVNHRIQRWFDHSEMKRVCGRFLPAQLQRPLSDLIGPAASSDLQMVARAFIELQDARHSADYDLGWNIPRSEAQQFVNLSRNAFAAWRRIRETSEANIFILSLLMWKNWERERP